MAAKLFDVTENEQGGYFSGWGKQITSGASVVGDATVLIPGLRSTKHTIVDSHTSTDRADLLYDRSGVSPPGVTGLAIGASKWFAKAIKLDANYVAQAAGGDGTGRFNVLLDIHGNQAVYTPMGVGMNATNGKWYVGIQGGGASLTNPSVASRYYDISLLNPGDTLYVECFITLNPDATGRCIVYASVNGSPLNSGLAVVDDTGPIGSTAETGYYPKAAHYRAGNLGGATSSVIHSGWIFGDSRADLAVPAAGTIKLGYLSGGTPVVGATVNANGIGKRGSGPETMPEDGTITHLADYLDYTGAGNIEALMVLYADNAGAPGAKLGQTRIYTPNAATDGSGFKELQLCQSVSRLAGQKHWRMTYFGANAALTRWRGDNVGANTFFSDSNGWAAPNGPSDPAGANATANPNRTKSGYVLYAVPRLDVQAPFSHCTNRPETTTAPTLSIGFTATDDTALDQVELYVQAPGALSYSLAAIDANANGTSYSGNFSYTFTAAGVYAFYTRAVDAAGNAEAPLGVPDLLVSYISPTDGSRVDALTTGRRSIGRRRF